MLSCWGNIMTGVARPIDNPLINNWLVTQREMYGSRVLTKFGATQEMVDVMEAHGALAFVADQNAGKKGMFVPFFGCLASSYKSIGLLAIQYNAPVVCGYAIRTGDMKFKIGIEDVILPEDWQAQPDALYYVTARYAHAIEKMVRRAPERICGIIGAGDLVPSTNMQTSQCPRPCAGNCCHWIGCRNRIWSVLRPLSATKKELVDRPGRGADNVLPTP